MKKILIMIIIMIVSTYGIFAQVDISKMETSFSDFANDISKALPFVSTMGLNWSDARVRSLPHFGIGLTAGTVFIPAKAFTNLASTLNFTLPDEILDANLGIPFPVYPIEGRIGKLFLPFDIGIKLGYLPPDFLSKGDVRANYLLAGFDIRTPIIKGNLALPSITLSAGYNYLSGGITAVVKNAGNLSEINLSPVIDTTLSYANPDIYFTWKTHTIDFKLQTSKKLLNITPYAGLGYSYGWSEAGGGISSDITYSDGESEKSVRQKLEDAGYNFDLSSDGFTILSKSSAGSMRIYGGFSISFLLLNLDLNTLYNINTASLGASINARMAF